jgi:uncharacterized protein
MKKTLFLLLLSCLIGLNGIHAQDKLYPNTFALSDVKLLDGPFKHACDLNIKVLLEYDADRFLAPYRREAGLPEKAKSYGNWESQGLDGHVGGHYLSALAIHYAATGNLECRKRMDYMVQEFKAVQLANSAKYPSWGVGYIGGIPKSDVLWTAIQKGDVAPIWKYWVPWYNLHKTFAGLRDAWLYGGNMEAKDLFLKSCDWTIQITKNLSDAQMESMLGNEHGGMNELFADAYQMTGNKTYLEEGKRFSHKSILQPMSNHTDNLDNKHANTQVPKAVGFQRLAEVSGDKTYDNAGTFFWETVTGNRSLALGGNSRKEFFPPAAACMDYINDVEGPESCNTYNMLKLTEVLFRMHPQANYADFYERAMFNHILSTQHPEHGGYVYFTPARPRHYRVYSAPNEAMWCCVGSGMENHGKYGEFIYTHSHDSLFVNLFVASELNWKAKKVVLRQETQFPNEEGTKLVVKKGNSRFKLIIRYPSWVEAGKLAIQINGKPFNVTAKPSSFITIERLWKKGDVVEVSLPMHTTIEPLINVPSYVAFMHGPILLAARTGTEKMTGLVAGDGRWEHIASGQKLPVNEAPIIIEDKMSDIAKTLQPVAGKALTFTAPNLHLINSKTPIVLEPFYGLHDSRYMMYWMVLSNKDYQHVTDSIAQVEAAKMELDKRTIDQIQPGQQQPEADHFMENNGSRTGTFQNEFWREARNGGFISYQLSTKSAKNLAVRVRYWGSEQGDRSFDILIDNQKLATENVTGKWNASNFMEVEYAIPAKLVEGKSTFKLQFQAPQQGSTARIFYIRLVNSQE